MANNTMTKLATTTVGSGGASSVTFSAIPQNYTDLVVKLSVRESNTGGAGWDNTNISINANAGNQSGLYLLGYSTGVSSGLDTNGVIRLTSSTATANTFSNGEITFPNYTSSNPKSYSIDVVDENNSTTAYYAGNFLASYLANIVNPITSLTFTAQYGYVQYSTFTLYGVYAGGTTTPSAPTIASATDLGGGTAQVTISSPAAIPYTVTSSPGGITATGMSPIQISGLSPQTSYTFTAQAVAPFGVSAASSASSSVSMYNGMTALATVLVGAGGASSILFSSIPSGYSHLQIRAISRTTAAATNSSWAVSFNSDTTGANYISHLLYGDGSSAGSTSVSGSNGSVYTSNIAGANAISGVFAASILDILDYSNTNKYKTSRLLTGWDNNGTGSPAGYAEFDSGLWMSTAAITSITIVTNNNFAQYSTFVLYGVK